MTGKKREHHVIGIDPGLTGAIAIVSPTDEVILCTDLPLTDEDKPSVDGNLLYRLIDKFMPCTVVVEKVHAMPGQGVTSMFNFGKSYGTILTAVKIAGANLLGITPQVWKKAQGLIKTEKEDSRQLALKKYPAAFKSLLRKKDHGRAEALLICDYYINL
jgi:crossover junction endodeoxyribonuclease RuvC